MKKIIKLKHLLVFMGLFLLLCSNSLRAQSPSGVFINWNIEVGCQTYLEDVRDPGKPVYIEEIGNDPNDCIRVCERSTVTYTLSGNLGASPGTVWTVTGGNILSQNTTTCVVNWGIAGGGSIGFTITTPNGFIDKTICMKKINIPIANFSCTATMSFPENDLGRPEYFACQNQTIYFTDLSSANGESQLVTYLWDFSDGTTSSEQNPSHIYTADGSYTIYYTVTNECGCKNTKKMRINIKSKGFDILCPGVVCEGQTVTYSLPFDGRDLCKDHFNWSVSHGGHINSINHSNGDVSVTWDHVDASGFGFLTFNPSECELDCLLPTTVRIPVIQSNGTITGDAGLCQGEQGLYELPQWPSTDFHWQIVGDPSQTMAHLIHTDQRNQIVVEALQSGTVVLRATYENTLLHCGGSAEFTIVIGKPNAVRGNTTLCKNTTATYTTVNGGLYDWVIKKNTSTVVATATSSSSITYAFSATGSYTVSIASTAMCTSTTMGVTVYDLPQTPDLGSGETKVCPNAPYAYAIASPDATSTYNWEVTPAGSATFIGGTHVGNAVNISFNTLAEHHIIITRTSSLPIECTSLPKDIKIVTDEITAVIATHVGTDATICDNHVGQYDAINSVASGLYAEGENYTWSIYDNNVSPAPAPSYGSITTGQGTNQISILWNDVSAIRHAKIRLDIVKCTLPVKTIYFDVTIVPAPQIKILGPLSVCSNTTVQFEVTSTDATIPLAPGTQVTWNMGYGTLPTPYGLIKSQHYFNSSNTNLIRTITATITNPNGCDGTVTASFQLEVIPGPNASVSITQGGNAYCNAASITTELTASTSAGATIAWYVNGNPTGATGSTYNPTNFGIYNFIATDPISHCTNPSNNVYITQLNCIPPASCALPEPVVTNTSTTECHLDSYNNTEVAIHLTGSITAPYAYTEVWNIQGPNDYSNVTSPYVLVSKAGQYNVIHSAYYVCSGQTLHKDVLQVVTVPYIPKFNYKATCNGNSSFTISVTDNTDFFTPVTDKTYTYYIKPAGDPDTSYVQVLAVTGDVGDGSFPLTYGSGAYTIKLVVGGKYNGNPMPTCEKVLTTPQLTTVPAMSISSTPLIIPCYDTAVGFELTPNPIPNNYTYLWTFDDGAQNTLASPSRVFDNPGLQPVSVKVTNKYGCVTNPELGATVTIPVKCFVGTITATPASAEVCSPGGIHLHFTPTVQNCPPDSYTWMRGTTPIATTNGLTNDMVVYTSGFYWVKVKSANNYTFETTNRITPLFKVSPSVKLETAASYCEGDAVAASVATNGTNIKWYLNGLLQSGFSNQSVLNLGGLAVGSYTILVSAEIDGCSNSASQTVTVNPKPEEPHLSSHLVTCEPYQYKVTVDNGPGNYTWSNGMNGDVNVVTNGGPIRVYNTLGGCRSFADITIPKNPDNYSWSFPSGCYDKCDKEVVGTLIGPNASLEYWAWLFNGSPVSSGYSSFPTPYAMTTSGTYNFMYTLGTCDHVGLPLDYTVYGCEKCPVEQISPRKVDLNQTKYCSYTVTLSISSAYGIPVTANLASPNDEVMIQPSSFLLTPGTADYTFTFVPINGYSGGAIELLFTSTLEGRLCQNDIHMELPNCGDRTISKMLPTELQSALSMYPNPAKDSVRIAFDSPTPGSTIEVYDLTRRLMSTYAAEMAKGEWELSLGTFASGVYVVVLKNATHDIIMQKKLLKE